MIPAEPPPMSLFERLGQGDPDAMNEICIRYGRRVYRLARQGLRGGLRDYVESGDIAQESMEAVIREAQGCRFASEAVFLGWLQRIVEHRILAAAKRRQAARRHGEGVVNLDNVRCIARNGESPSGIVMRREAGDKVADALAKLSNEDRAVVIARAILKLPWEAIARSLDQNKAALQMRYARVRRQLGKTLTRWDSTSSDAARALGDST